MSDLNSVVLVGRLTRDIEVSYTGGGTCVGNFSIAVNRTRVDGGQRRDETSFFDVLVFGKTAEGLRQYLVKGKQVALQGCLQQDRWEKDGQRFSRVRIMANSLELLGGSAQDGAQQPQQGYQTQQSRQLPPQANPQGYPPSQQGYPPSQQGQPYGDGYGSSVDGFTEDVPF